MYKFSQAGGKLSPVPQPPNEELKSGDFTLTSAQLSGEFLGGAATLEAWHKAGWSVVHAAMGEHKRAIVENHTLPVTMIDWEIEDQQGRVKDGAAAAKRRGGRARDG